MNMTKFMRIFENMNIKHGNGKTKFGPGVDIHLTGDEIATAIHAWLVSHDVNVFGASTVTVNDELISFGRMYVDPSAFVISEGVKISGRGLATGESDGC